METAYENGFVDYRAIYSAVNTLLSPGARLSIFHAFSPLFPVSASVTTRLAAVRFPSLVTVIWLSLIHICIPVESLKLHDLRCHIGLATQDVLLYSDTIEGNIAYGDGSIHMEDVVKFARYSSASDFIAKMPEGYDTIVGERGVGLSGGQKQRISLARALAVRPSVLILDDTTSAVDMETEKQIQHSLKELD